MKDKKVVCVYIDDEGVYHKVDGTKNVDGTYTFCTGHFSAYAILAAEEADKILAEQEKARLSRIKAGVKATTIKAWSSAKKEFYHCQVEEICRLQSGLLSGIPFHKEKQRIWKKSILYHKERHSEELQKYEGFEKKAPDTTTK